MLRYAGRRLPSMVLVLILASVAVFLLIHLAPGDPAAVLAGPDANPETVHAIRLKLGLDQSLVHQYATWISGLVTGNLGRSYTLSVPVAELIGHSAVATLELTLTALCASVVLGFIVGVGAVATKSRVIGVVARIFNTLSLAVPTFVTGVVLVLLFAISIRVFPAGGRAAPGSSPFDSVRYLVLPAITLALPVAAVISRFLTSALSQGMREEYVETATSLGVSHARILLRHALPNALPQVVTVTAIQTGQLLGGSLIVEAIFAWPGLGQLMLSSVLSRDYLVVQDMVLLAVVVFVVIQTAADLAQASLDPRIKVRLS